MSVPAGLPDAALLQDTANAQRAKSLAGKKPTRAEIEKTAVEFEAMFLSAMLQPVFASLKTGDSLFGGGHGESAFQPMLIDEYAKIMAKSGQLGVANMVRTQMLRMQEVE
jgi:Rod binding domain-containing protein